MHLASPFSALLAADPALADGVPVADGFWSLALTTPTLPPATRTNTAFVGRAHPYIVDPATPHPAERERLRRAVEVFTAHGRAPDAIVLTHHHHDHVGAAAWLAETFGLPIRAHARTAELLNLPIIPLEDGAVLRGSDEHDDGWQVLHTPGHASGHIILREPERGLIVGGDLVASVGTIVVDPPDGHMATYLHTLALVRDLDPRVILPSHGSPIAPPEPLLSGYIAHRLQREDKIRRALSRTPAALADVTRLAYAELDPRLLPLARRATLAHLQKLYEDGEVLARSDGGEALEPLADGALWELA